MPKHNRTIYVRLTEEQYQALMPKDGRSIGNEIRHRIFGEPYKTDRGRPKIQEACKRSYQISINVTDKEYEAVKKYADGEPISKSISDLILKRITKFDEPFIECEYNSEPRNHVIGLRFTKDGYDELMEYMSDFCGTVSCTVRHLIFGRE